MVRYASVFNRISEVSSDSHATSRDWLAGSFSRIICRSAILFKSFFENWSIRYHFQFWCVLKIKQLHHFIKVDILAAMATECPMSTIEMNFLIRTTCKFILFSIQLKNTFCTYQCFVCLLEQGRTLDLPWILDTGMATLTKPSVPVTQALVDRQV